MVIDHVFRCEGIREAQPERFPRGVVTSWLASLSRVHTDTRFPPVILKRIAAPPARR